MGLINGKPETGNASEAATKVKKIKCGSSKLMQNKSGMHISRVSKMGLQDHLELKGMNIRRSCIIT